MESLVKQMRVRFSGLGDSNQGPSNIRDRKLPLQKTQSFKGGKKTQNWFQRQFPAQMSPDNDFGNNNEFAMAVAAAAFAINSLEEGGSQNPNKTIKRQSTSLNKNKSRKEDGMAGFPEPGRVPRRFSEKEIDPGEASMRKSEEDQRMAEGLATNQKMPGKTVGTGPTIKKTPTFSEGYLNGKGGTKPGTEVDTSPALDRTFSRSSSRKDKTTATGEGETKADAWEKAEMARIRKKFERMNSTIVSWETEKKTKAKKRVDKAESELERKRARTLQRYRNEISRIDQIAGGARAAAEERRRNEETTAKEKANKIRATGKVPATCICF